MKKNIIVALVILLGSVLFTSVGTVFAQGASCDAGGGTEGVLNAEGVCVSTRQTPAGSSAQDTTQQPQSVQSGFTALAPVPGLTDTANTSVVNSDSLATFFNNLYKYLIGLAAILAIGEIIWAGIKIATNQDSVSTITDSKGRIAQALLGLALVLSPVLVFSIINPSILNLSINLPALDTRTSNDTYAPESNRQGDGTGAALTDSETGCVITGAEGFLQTATCSTDKAANDWASTNCFRRGNSSTEQKSTCTTTGCTEQTKAVVTCRYLSDAIAFVDTGVRFTTSYNLQPIRAEDSSKFETFYRGCTNSGGVTCTLGGMKTKGASNCGDFGGYPDEKLPRFASGKCYSTTLVCLSQSAADRANSYLPTSQEALINSCPPTISYTLDSIQ